MFGNFSSPNWPEKYPNEIRCVYNFRGNKFQAINLTFFVFDVEAPFAKGYVFFNILCNFYTINAFIVITNSHLGHKKLNAFIIQKLY